MSDSSKSEPRNQWERMLDPGTEGVLNLADQSSVSREDYAALPEEERALFQQYTDVLMFMHWAQTQEELKTKPLGQLLRMGCEHVAKIPIPDEKMQYALLHIAFKLIALPFPKPTL